MKDHYPLEKFNQAVRDLAISADSLPERLFSAFLTFHPVQEEQLPTPELRKSYARLVQEMTKYKASGDEGDVQATLKRLSPDELQDLARQILDIRFQLEADWHHRP